MNPIDRRADKPVGSRPTGFFALRKFFIPIWVSILVFVFTDLWSPASYLVFRRGVQFSSLDYAPIRFKHILIEQYIEFHIP